MQGDPTTKHGVCERREVEDPYEQGGGGVFFKVTSKGGVISGEVIGAIEVVSRASLDVVCVGVRY